MTVAIGSVEIIETTNSFLDVTGPIQQLLTERSVKVDLIEKMISSFSENQNFTETLCCILSTGKEYDQSRQITQIKRIPAATFGFNNKDIVLSLIDAEYWERSIHMLHLHDYMSGKAKAEWELNIATGSTPPFTTDVVYPTLQALIKNSSHMMAERIDAIFNVLSGTHVTNSPYGFNATFIIENAYTESVKDAFHDLRASIYVLLGRLDTPTSRLSRAILTIARNEDNRGKWLCIDGGALEMKAHKCGTVHIRLNESLAFKMNDYLAMLYPAMLASGLAKAKLSKAKKPAVIQQTLNNDVINELKLLDIKDWILTLNKHERAERVKLGYFQIITKSTSAPMSESLRDVLALIGGVPTHDINNDFTYKFDYDPNSVINSIVLSGTVPDSQSYQFYHTSGQLAATAVAEADIQTTDDCLEPSAGNGGLAGLMPKNQTTCVEISKLRCEILESKGFRAVNADFIEFAKTAPLFHKIVMNPPYCNEQYLTHIDAAMNILHKGGVIIAILPTNFKHKSLPNNFQKEEISVHNNAFKGTKISVGLYRITRLDW